MVIGRGKGYCCVYIYHLTEVSHTRGMLPSRLAYLRAGFGWLRRLLVSAEISDRDLYREYCGA